ncbi:hypothetical protein T01_5577 [Trichinella spiralis]|uniref:Uncharacterized protein n=1 Tax=Trichinella spiralis TaxID=6334 RepID=A0A0V0YZH6_TRISP|nr:hypothetical protein T01_5577 [Trichinella spiralis]
MNEHITLSPYSRFSVMIVRKKLFRCFTAVKLCSALAQSIGVKAQSSNNRLAAMHEHQTN